MAETYYKLRITRGDTFDLWTAVYDGPKANGLKDLTGYTGRMHLRETPNSPEILLSFFVEVGSFAPIRKDTGQPWPCNVHIAATAYQTGKLPTFGLGTWDLELTDGFGHPWTTLKGVAELDEDTTR